MDNKVKHRIVGVVVIAVFLVILIPALIKNVIWKNETVSPFASTEGTAVMSEQSNGANMTQPQPRAESFQTSQIAHVSLDNPMIQAEPIASSNNSSQTNMAIAQEVPVPTATMVQTSVPTDVVQPRSASMAMAQPAISAVAQPAQVVVPEPVMTVATASTPVKAAPVVTSTMAPMSAPAPVSKPVVAAPAPKPVVKTSAPVVTPKPVPVVKKVVQKPVVAPKKVVITQQPAVVSVKQLSTPHAPKPVSAIAVGQKPVRTCLQMGAFSNADNAQSLVNSLKAKGFASATKEAITLPNGKMGQRVVMCQMMTRNEALAMRARVAQVTGTTPMIVK